MPIGGDFYEDDEPIGDIVGAWRAGRPGVTGPPPRARSRLWLETRWHQYRRPFFMLHLRLAGQLVCGCHWHPTYGPVVMGGCARHD